jgi:superfamily II DNA helicase RecQ
MKLKVFTLRPDEQTGCLDDSSLERFFGDPESPRQILEISEHFFVHQQEPRWAILTMYRDIPRHEAVGTRGRKDWRAELAPEERLLFDVLRAWRGRKAKSDGVPPYVIATDRQLADIARNKPGGPGDLLKISGMGQGKVSRWGEEVVAQVQNHVVMLSEGVEEASHG